MKLIDIAPIALTVELDPTDCLALADAIGWSVCHDIKGDHSHLTALRAALTAGAFAAFLAEDGMERRQRTLAGLREVWAPHDEHTDPPARVLDLDD